MSRPGALARSMRPRAARAAALVLALLALLAVFADVLAGDAPLVLVRGSSVSVLPGVTRHAELAGKRAADIEKSLGPSDHALWPLVRSGPTLATDVAPLAPPGAGHPLGTDAFGRDVFARLVHGARTALGLGLLATLASLVLGCAIGGLAGTLGGLWDGVVERLVELLGVFPVVILAALLRAVERSPSLLPLVVTVSLFRWAEVARLARLLVMRAHAEEWVIAARALGASPARIAWRHVAPNAVGPILVSAVFSMGAVVLVETSLSFLGLGVPVDVASWGEMLAEVRWGARPLVVLLPAAALASTLAAVYVVGDGLRSALDPHGAVRRVLG